LNVIVSNPGVEPASAQYSVSVYDSVGTVAVALAFQASDDESETAGDVGVPPSLVTTATRRSLLEAVVKEAVKELPLLHSPLPLPSIVSGFGPGDGSEPATSGWSDSGSVAWPCELAGELADATARAIGVEATETWEETEAEGVGET